MVNVFIGVVDFYVFDEDDVILKVWDKIFLGMFQFWSNMLEVLQAYIWYLVDYLLIQGLVYVKYYMNDFEVFYNQEDLWICVIEKYYGSVQLVEFYYIMWQFLNSEEVGFLFIFFFIFKNWQVFIGWIVGFCDLGQYGWFLVYNFLKEKWVFGLQQVEIKID